MIDYTLRLLGVLFIIILASAAAGYVIAKVGEFWK